MAQILPIRLYGDPILRKKATTVRDFSAIPQLAEDMFESMFEAAGVGLAGPQIGQGQRIFVFAEYADPEEAEEGEGDDASLRGRVREQWVVVNPTITWRDGLEEGLEGCLSLPGLTHENVPRSTQIRLEYQDEYGVAQILEAEDYLARVIQHELDHLDGVLYIDRLTRGQRALFMEENRDDLAQFQREAKQFLRDLEARR